MDDSAVINRRIAFFCAFLVAYWTLIIYQRNSRDPIRYSLLEKNRERMVYLQILVRRDIAFVNCACVNHKMAGNNVVWQPQIVEEMLRYYKEKIQNEGRQFVFKEVHHEECAKQINEKYQTNFTSRQVYHKFHKLKSQWKVILDAKNGANFDDVEKKKSFMMKQKLLRMKGQNLLMSPYDWYDEMEFIFQDKHATGEFTVLQAPYDHPMTKDVDFIGEKEGNCLPEQENDIAGSSSSKRPKGGKTNKCKRVKATDDPILKITGAMDNMSETMHFNHVTHPNESLFNIIDDMVEYPVLVRLQVQTYLATNADIAAMLKGRPLDFIKEYVAQWIVQNYP
uniref:Myb/SANT-like domain-containing protein n=1 Tax=Leersia perrieri TaxID=77586 RepID=A0A0D9XMR1_9ORYZ